MFNLGFMPCKSRHEETRAAADIAIPVRPPKGWGFVQALAAAEKQARSTKQHEIGFLIRVISCDARGSPYCSYLMFTTFSATF